MNENEAIRIIEFERDNNADTLMALPPAAQKRSNLKDKIEAQRMAIEALERRIPKKPKMRHLKWYDGYNDGWCPCCESYVQELDFDKYFCQGCGQALDWKDDSEVE